MALSFLELANWEIGLSGRERHQPRKCERLWTPPLVALRTQCLWIKERIATRLQRLETAATRNMHDHTDLETSDATL
jgi:hypothetical protein